MTLGKKLQLLRKARSMSQEQLAEALGVSRQAVSKWELDATLPDTANVIALGKLFGVTTDYLLVEETAETPAARPAHSEKRNDWNMKSVAGGMAAVFCALGWFAVYIVSRFVEVMVPYTYRDEFGEVWTNYSSSHTDVDFGLFVKEYHLEGLLIGLAVVFTVGIVIALWDKYIGPFAGKMIERARGSDE